MRGMRIEALYNLLGRTDASSCYHIFVPDIDEISSCVVDSTMLWHRRLGHNEKGLRTMQNKAMVKAFPNVHLNLISVKIASMVRQIM